jgi:glycosyltransferase involved in cell wall biosynthesis
MAIDAARGDWILQLDADEVVSPELAQDIISSIQDLGSNICGYWINRKNWFLNRFLTKGGQYPDPTLRLYRRGLGRLPAKDVHEQAVVKGSVGHLHSDLLHYRDTSFAKYLEGFNRYSSLLAGQMKNIPVNIFTVFWFLFLKPAYIFLNIYVRHLGLVDGFAGFVFALFSGLIWGVAFIKYWQEKYFPSNAPLPKLE